MRILLHMGQGKTGTTALQRSLHASRKLLEQHGVLYPELAPGGVAHHMLMALCESDDRIPPHVVAPFGSLEMLRAKAAAALYQLRVEIERSRPAVLVLSSETFFHGLRRPAKELLERLLAPLSGEVQPVIYVREPGDLYRARLQERMKVAATPLPPGPQVLREAIEDTEAVLGKPAVCGYGAGHLKDGDIARDFASRFLADRIDPSLLATRRDNPSLSAESILALSRLRKLVAQDRDWHRDPRSSRLMIRLQAIEATEPGWARMALRPGIAEAVRRASVDYLWLRDRFGVSFAELDYAAIDGMLPGPEWAALPLEELVEWDRERYESLLLAVLARELGK
jgi:hypothetical protein